MKINGIWLGLVVALVLQFFCFFRVILQTSWQAIANASQTVMENFRATQKQLA